ncbi:MAG: hypothetical protein ABIZ56_01550, partial [Chthoniobacteraceae bacterium]
MRTLGWLGLPGLLRLAHLVRALDCLLPLTRDFRVLGLLIANLVCLPCRMLLFVLLRLLTPHFIRALSRLLLLLPDLIRSLRDFLLLTGGCRAI